MSAQTLFVIDDDADLGAAVREELEAYDFVVRSFTKAQDALNDISHDAPAAVIVDRWLPEMSGDAFIAAARAAGHRVPIVLMSGDGKLDGGGFGEGVVLLPKPFDIERLLAAVHSAMSARDGDGAR
jgi:FixJ family two-component response regulator